MKLHSVQVIPALPGYRVVYEQSPGGDVFVAEEIIAWRIDNYWNFKVDDEDGESVRSYSEPLTVDGSSCENLVGVLNPDKTFTWTGIMTYESLEAFVTERNAERQSEITDKPT